MNVPWKLGRHSGVVVADSEKEAMAEVLGNPPFEPKPDECYSFSFGSLTGNAYGDEFHRMAGASKIDDAEVDMSSGYLHDDPVRKQLDEKLHRELEQEVLRRASMPGASDYMMDRAEEIRGRMPKEND